MGSLYRQWNVKTHLSVEQHSGEGEAAVLYYIKLVIKDKLAKKNIKKKWLWAFHQVSMYKPLKMKWIFII